jgi:hypothetical protein
MNFPSYSRDLSGQPFIEWLSLAFPDDPAFHILTDVQILQAFRTQHIYPIAPLPDRLSAFPAPSSSDAILPVLQPISHSNILHRCKIATLTVDSDPVGSKGKDVAPPSQSEGQDVTPQPI